MYVFKRLAHLSSTATRTCAMRKLKMKVSVELQNSKKATETFIWLFMVHSTLSLLLFRFVENKAILRPRITWNLLFY